MSIVTPATFKPELLTLGKLETTPNKAQFVYVSYNGGIFRVQMPRMPVAFNAGDYNGNKKYKVSFSFKEMETVEKVKKYFQMLVAIDKRLIELLAANSDKYLKRADTASVEYIAKQYNSSIKYKIDQETEAVDTSMPPTHNIALKQAQSGEFTAQLFDKYSRLMEDANPLDVFKRDAEATSVVKLSVIWYVQKKFSPAWTLVQSRIDVPVELDSAPKFMGESLEDDVSPPPSPAKRAPAPSAPPAPESDDEDDEVDDEEDLKAAIVDDDSETEAIKAASNAIGASYDDSDEDEEVIKPVEVPPKKTRAVKKR